MIEIAFSNTFEEFAALLTLAAVMGFIGLALRQPLIVAFIATGIIAGPAVLGLAQSEDAISLFAKLGVSVLLFLVGLQLDVKLVRSVGPVALFTGLGQVVFTSVIGFGICLALGFSAIVSLYVSVALTFSSTIIIVKLLSDKRELESLYGRIALGFLIVQDIVVVLAMIVLSAIGIGGKGEDTGAELLRVLGFGVLLLAAVAVFIRYIANPLTRRLVRSPELVVTFGIGWAAVVATLAHAAGLSMELGGLLAGVALASTPYREAIASRLISVRDFMLLFFFVELGSKLDLSTVGDEVVAAFLLSVFVLVGNPLIVMIIMGVMGYRKRTGFLAGLTVAQISEFSLIFIAMGLTIGAVPQSTVGLVTLVGLITIATSTYMILYSHRLYTVFEPVLGWFERKVPFREMQGQAEAEGKRYDAIVFGMGRLGENVARGLKRRGMTVLGVDFDPRLVARLKGGEMDVWYGAVDDAEFIASLPLNGTNWVICTIPPLPPGPVSHDHRKALIDQLRQRNYSGRMALTARDARDAVEIRRAGADLVMLPFVDASRYIVEEIAGPEGRHVPGEPGRQAVGKTAGDPEQ